MLELVKKTLFKFVVISVLGIIFRQFTFLSKVPLYDYVTYIGVVTLIISVLILSGGRQRMDNERIGMKASVISMFIAGVIFLFFGYALI